MNMPLTHWLIENALKLKALKMCKSKLKKLFLDRLGDRKLGYLHSFETLNAGQDDAHDKPAGDKLASL